MRGSKAKTIRRLAKIRSDRLEYDSQTTYVAGTRYKKREEFKNPKTKAVNSECFRGQYQRMKTTYKQTRRTA